MAVNLHGENPSKNAVTATAAVAAADAVDAAYCIYTPSEIATVVMWAGCSFLFRGP